MEATASCSGAASTQQQYNDVPRASREHRGSSGTGIPSVLHRLVLLTLGPDNKRMCNEGKLLFFYFSVRHTRGNYRRRCVEEQFNVSSFHTKFRSLRRLLLTGQMSRMSVNEHLMRHAAVTERCALNLCCQSVVCVGLGHQNQVISHHQQLTVCCRSCFVLKFQSLQTINVCMRVLEN